MNKNIAARPIMPAQQVMRMGRLGWVAGMNWQMHDLVAQKKRFFSRADGATHRLKLLAKAQQITGQARPLGVQPGLRLCSLAAAYLAREGGSHYGIYQLDAKNDKWLFLATTGGLPSVMGDIIGTLNEVLSAQQRFLDFNAPESSTSLTSLSLTSTALNCTATSETPVCWQTLTTGLSRQAIRATTLGRLLSGRTIACFALPVLLGSTAFWYWGNQLDKAEMVGKVAQAKALLELQSQNVTESTKEENLPHPWASIWPTPYFLSQCLVVRQRLPVTLTGWRLAYGECVSEGMRLRYAATAASTIADFSHRARELLGQDAYFNLEEGGQNGDVLIPFVTTDSPSLWRDEKIPPSAVQLMQFISHFQRRNISVLLNEVKPPPVVPGQENTIPSQGWREFTFTFTTKSSPEGVLASIDDIGLRLTSIAFTLNPQSQFEYTIKGSLYAQN